MNREHPPVKKSTCACKALSFLFSFLSLQDLYECLSITVLPRPGVGTRWGGIDKPLGVSHPFRCFWLFPTRSTVPTGQKKKKQQQRSCCTFFLSSCVYIYINEPAQVHWFQWHFYCSLNQWPYLAGSTSLDISIVSSNVYPNPINQEGLRKKKKKVSILQIWDQVGELYQALLEKQLACYVVSVRMFGDYIEISSEPTVIQADWSLILWGCLWIRWYHRHQLQGHFVFKSRCLHFTHHWNREWLLVLPDKINFATNTSMLGGK